MEGENPKIITLKENDPWGGDGLASDGKVVISTALDNSGLPKGIGQAKGMLGGLDSVVKKLGGVITAAFSETCPWAFAAMIDSRSISMSEYGT